MRKIFDTSLLFTRIEKREKMMMDNCRKSWALRYIREAKAELKAARKMPYISSSLVMDAIRKARNAIHYSLGEPTFVESIIKENSDRNDSICDPVLKCLVGIEKTADQLIHLNPPDGEEVIDQADNLIQLASDIVEVLTEG